MPTDTLHIEGDGLEIHKVVVGPYENNVFVLRCTETGDAVLLDAANEHDRLLELCRALGVTSVLETHGHWDHIQAVPQLPRRRLRGRTSPPRTRRCSPSYDQVLDDDSVIEVGRLRLRTIHTPGHTRGSMCFLVEGRPLLFSGDTLFPGGPGNTKNGGHFPTIIESVESKLFTLPPDTLVMPGHGLDTTVGTERPHLQEWIDRGW